MSDFIVKDSGVREEYSTGMVRDTQEGKARFSLLRPVGVPYDKQFTTRCAQHMTLGGGKYGLRNWEKAHTQEELDRFQDSAERHMNQYLAGASDEDHAAAVVFNLIAAETCRYKMSINWHSDDCKCRPENPFELRASGGWQIASGVAVTPAIDYTVVNEVETVPYHTHKTRNEPDFMGLQDAAHRELLPHAHKSGAVIAHDPTKDIDPYNHTR